MATDAREIHAVFDAALALPQPQRVELAEILMASLNGPESPEMDAEWIAEIKRRAMAVDRGESKLHHWRDVIKEMREERKHQ